MARINASGQVPRLTVARPLVTVGIIVRNEAAHIGETLSHVLASDFPCDDFEILVVDGRSTDGTADIVRGLAEKYPKIKLVVEPWKSGTHGMARNLAGEHARGQYLAFTDGDCVVAPTWLATLVSRLSVEHERDSSVVGAGGPRVPAPTDDWRARLISAVMTTHLGSGGSQGFVPTKRRYTESVPNYNAIYVADVVKRERYSELGVGDDYEFNTRLVQKGYRLAFECGAVVYHHQEGGFWSFFRQAFRYGWAQVEVFGLRRRMRYFAPLAALFTVALPLGPASLWFSPSLAKLYLAGLVTYLASVLVNSIRIAILLKDLRGMLSVALYPGLHFSYGLGVLAALATSRARGRTRNV